MASGDIEIAVEISHASCGTAIGIFSSVDDNGSVEVRCPGCHRWIEIFNQFISQQQQDVETHNQVYYRIVHLPRC